MTEQSTLTHIWRLYLQEVAPTMLKYSIRFRRILADWRNWNATE